MKKEKTIKGKTQQGVDSSTDKASRDNETMSQRQNRSGKGRQQNGSDGGDKRAKGSDR